MAESTPAKKARTAVPVEKMMMFMDRYGPSMAGCVAWSVGPHYAAAACLDVEPPEKRTLDLALELLYGTPLGPAACGCRDVGWHVPAPWGRSITEAGMNDFAKMLCWTSDVKIEAFPRCHP